MLCEHLPHITNWWLDTAFVQPIGSHVVTQSVCALKHHVVCYFLCPSYDCPCPKSGKNESVVTCTTQRSYTTCTMQFAPMPQSGNKCLLGWVDTWKIIFHVDNLFGYCEPNRRRIRLLFSVISLMNDKNENLSWTLQHWWIMVWRGLFGVHVFCYIVIQLSRS